MSPVRALIWLLWVVALVMPLPASAASRGARRRGQETQAGPSAPKVSSAAISIGNARPSVAGIERQVILALPEQAAHPTLLRLLPAEIGIEVDVTLPPERASALTETIPTPWIVNVRPILGGSRLRVVHPTRSIAVEAGRHRGDLLIAFGVIAEEGRLRMLADRMQLPLPEPSDLGADLEVWQEAERVTAAGDLEEAKRRWERLLDVSQLADLAALRVAELYIASGHINEAVARLRAVSRDYPRSTGAALARLDVLHLDALLRTGAATVEQVNIASAVIDRPGFEEFARLRAAMVLREMGEPALGLLRMPTISSLPHAWLVPGEMERQTLASLALAAPVLRENPRKTAIHQVAVGNSLGDHLDGDRILDAVAQAYADIGLHDRSIPILQARLRTFPAAVEEADIVVRLAHAYRMLGDHARADEAIDYLVATHPHVPDLLAEIRALAISQCRRAGLEAGRRRLATLRELDRSDALERGLIELDIDLTLAWGSSAQIVQVVSSMAVQHPWVTDGSEGAVRLRELAVALVRESRPAEAVPRLRALVDRQADPEARDRLGYHLALAEDALGQTGDAQVILTRIALDGTRWGSLARAFLYERRLARAIASLETTRPDRGVQ